MLLKQGYGLEETLLICEDITRFPYVDTMIDQMKIGMDVKEIIMEAPLPTLFLEFFDFFSERFTLALAIKNSLDICDHVKEIKKQLRKDRKRRQGHARRHETARATRQIPSIQ